MPDSVEVELRGTLLGSDGSTIGVVVPTDQLRELQAECERLRQQIGAQEAHLAERTRELEKAHQEREEYRRSLHAVLHDYFAEHEAEVIKEALEADRTGLTFDQVMRELNEVFHVKRGGEHGG